MIVEQSTDINPSGGMRSQSGRPLALGSPLLTLTGVSKRFGGVTALDSVNFELRVGESHGLIGENGAGKSTMMKVLSGVHGDYEGEMRLGKELVRFTSPADALSRGIGMMYQELSIFSHLTVAENLFGKQIPRRRGFVDWTGMNEVAQQHLNELGLDIDVRLPMSALPVGNQQLVEIARVIFSGAQCIILDEPTSALSAPEAARLFEFMATLKGQGKTLVFISHFLDDVIATTDRISVLKNSRRVATLVTEGTTKHQLVELMIGADAEILKPAYEDEISHADLPKPEEPGESAPAALELEGFTRAGAFSDVSLALRPGEIVGLFGFMGAGQSQLAHCMFGAAPVDSGTLRMQGKPLRLKNTSHARAAGLAFVPEDRRNALMMQKEVYKNMTLAHLAKLVPWWMNEKKELELAEEQVKNVGLRPPNIHLPVGALSGGNQQKVVLAKWLTQQPRVLILSEPTRGMDVGAKEEVINIAKRLRAEGVAILLITTEPEVILDIANRALVMSKGKITAELSGQDLTKEALMKHA